MSNEDEKLYAVLGLSQRHADGSVPDFEVIFGAAERRLRDRRRIRFAGVAAAVGLTVMALGLLPTAQDDFTYVDLEELTATTRWSAPSDTLLPEYRIDLYRDLPQIFESTYSEEGALL